MLSSKEHLLQLKKMLHIEKQEGILEYQKHNSTLTVEQRKKKGTCWYPLAIQKTGYGLGDYPFVIVERTNMKGLPHQFSSGKPVALFSNQDNEKLEVNGTIHYVDKDSMKIFFFQNDLPDWVDFGKLGVNLLFDESSFDEMDNALNTVLDAENDRLAYLREVLLGSEEPKSSSADYRFEVPSLNPSQNKAVQNILEANDVAIIHGPPGTGKTTTLVEAIKQLSKKEKQILVCSPSNTAADLLTEKLVAEEMNVVRIGNLSRIDEKIVSHTLEGLIPSFPEAKDIKRIKKEAEEYRRMAFKYKRNFGRLEREQRKMLQREAKARANDAIELEDYLISKILEQAQVITCTLVGTMNRYIKNRNYSTVVIDEAAQALEPATWIPIIKADKVVLAGDPFQLPPTVKSREAAMGGLSKTLIEKCVERLPEVNLLDTQYRMNATIMGFSNMFFYDGKLKAHTSVIDGDIDGQTLEFIDTAGTGFQEEINDENVSLSNSGEAEVLRKHLEEFITLNPDVSVGVISPYKQQTIQLQELLGDLATQFDITINTIDSFQGQERDVIYISLVRSNEDLTIGFLSDYRRMNVAMTRAKKKLVIIGDSATIASDRFYQQFMDYVEAHGTYRTAWEFGIAE